MHFSNPFFPVSSLSKNKHLKFSDQKIISVLKAWMFLDVSHKKIS